IIKISANMQFRSSPPSRIEVNDQPASISPLTTEIQPNASADFNLKGNDMLQDETRFRKEPLYIWGEFFYVDRMTDNGATGLKPFQFCYSYAWRDVMAKQKA